MKKILIAAILTGGAVLLSSAQGTVKFSNLSSSFAVSTNTAMLNMTTWSGTGGTSGLTPPSSTAPGAYYFALLMQAYSSSATPNADPITGGWADTGLLATNYLLAGSINGNGTGSAVSGWAAGSSMFVEMVGWSASLGTTWSQVSSELTSAEASGAWSAEGYFGISGIGYVTSGGVGTPASPPAATFGGTGIPGTTTLYAVPVPEPTTLALAGLGGLALLMLRRRKACKA